MYDVKIIFAWSCNLLYDMDIGNRKWHDPDPAYYNFLVT